ncbi:MAG TPA: putative glycoside hydrolase, partial [Candidatus Paceibacterota bacterium]|nr:putative glycoside hydrolase [Candidatus Paceibacterota bacterium]
DYVMPMVYPSHYNAGFIGIAKPATMPYEVVKYSMDEAARRTRLLSAAAGSTSTSTEMLYLKAQALKGRGEISTDQLRPWLQDFDLGASYTPEMVRAQMRATYDAGLDSWALWDAGNTYTRAALLEE